MIQKTITICGSMRYKKFMIDLARKLLMSNFFVFYPETIIEGKIDDGIKNKLLFQHFNKIEKSDAIIVFNLDGYIGNATRLEIERAIMLGKDLYSIEPFSCQYFNEIYQFKSYMELFDKKKQIEDQERFEQLQKSVQMIPEFKLEYTDKFLENKEKTNDC